MIPSYVKNCSSFNDFSLEEKNKYFNLTGKKVIPNIDSLYFSVFLDEDEKEVFNISQMISFLSKTKENMVLSKLREYQLSNCDLILKLIRFSIYEYCLSINEMFDIFISSYLPNPDTPRIVIQLRSIGLWTLGTKELINQSLSALKDFLSYYDVKITKIGENRIDYAYHTNIIQNTYRYFNDSTLLKHLKSSLTKYSKIGSIGKKITMETMTLGNKKSNNIFFRTYNKTIEVVEMNYKGFFFEYWYQNQMISFYDKYCLEQAYKLKSYKTGLLYGRSMFYIEYGTNQGLKDTLKGYINTYRYKSSNCEEWEKLLDGVLPSVTMVMNVEFQTKRKFYQSCVISDLKCSVSKDDLLYNLYSIIDNQKVFLDYLTSKTVCFWDSKKNDFCQWWKLIRRVKIDTMTDLPLIRDYARSLDFDCLKSNIVSKVATASVYINNINEHDFTDDISDLLSVLNDNDMQIISTKTGEINPKIYIDDYFFVKGQKNNNLKKLLEGTKLKGD